MKFSPRNILLKACELTALSFALLTLGDVSISATHAADKSNSSQLTTTQTDFFEQKIRPVLVAECYECHAGKKHKGGLALDSRAGLLKGGDTGPGLIPGAPEKSLLIRTITHADKELKMPKNGAKLDDKVIADFVAWVKMGAPDPRDQPADIAPANVSWADTLAARKKWWSFQPVKKFTVPTPKNAAWSTNVIDRFLLAKMEAHGLQPASDADPRVLIRRLTFALTGLPPTPVEVETFVKESSIGNRQSAISNATNRLLASPAFGERWARHWMDLMRYADSHGSEGDPDILFAWCYRDYLIRAFNADVPADQLIREHLAGDLLPTTQTRWNRAENLNESILGIAHLRLVEHGFQPVDTLDDQVHVIENQVDVLGKAFQGLTLACARCHDHKFDPISQRDYTALYGILASSRPAQVQVDTPEVLNKNRAELTALKSRIKESLANEWLAAAPKLIAKLSQGSSADPQLTAAQQRATDLAKQIANIEAEVRAKVIGARTASPQVPANETSTGKLPALQFPQPIARWSFDTDARDQIGALHGELVGNAKISNGRLVLDGKDSFLRSAPLARELREKTLETWVAPANLDQRGGGVISVETAQPHHFDSIVFAEKEPRRWLSGSEFFKRTQAVAGPLETAAPNEFVHFAIAYRADGTITLFRNGALYGQAYKPTDAPHAFAAGTGRVLLGLRHTGAGGGFFAGEIDEARLYDHALSAEEMSASFKAGPVGVSAEEIAKAMTAEQKSKHAALAAELAKVRVELAAKSSSANDALAAALKDAQDNIANPLHVWTRLKKLDGDAFAHGWQEETKTWRTQLDAAREHNSPLKSEWNFANGDDVKWFRSNGNLTRADFSIEPEGERVVNGLLPFGVFTHALSQKHGALFTSPRFKITSDFISVRALGGKGAAVRVIVDNYPLPSNPIFPKAELTRDEPGWVRVDTAYRKGSWAYIEFGTSDDLTRKLGKNADASGRSWFGVERVVFHNKEAPREEPLAPEPLLSQASPKTAATLANEYERVLKRAIVAWREGKLSEPQRAFLDFFVRRGLLPNSLNGLNSTAPLVAEYRQLEAEISTPRRAPGVIEGTAYDAPLYTRGEHTKPTEPVPRRFLEVIASQPYSTKLSGRLELANEIASAQNPLTARVLVNRVWQHLYGRGLVATVDNFGKLGEKPTHPELLDYLAARFVAEGWSFKKLIRELVTTRAFQLGSEATATARETDAANDFLSHFRVQRLEAEAIRDALLTVSGRLDRTMFGAGAGGNGTPRRSLYLTIRRTNLNPFLETFDAPKPFTTLGRRDATNVPAQSLALLNDPFVIDLAHAWAAALIAREPDAEARVREMFTAAFARPPSADELAKARAFLAELARDANVSEAQLAASERVWQDFAQSLFNLKEFIYVR